jgi:hypothetical protein
MADLLVAANTFLFVRLPFVLFFHLIKKTRLRPLRALSRFSLVDSALFLYLSIPSKGLPGRAASFFLFFSIYFFFV